MRFTVDNQAVVRAHATALAFSRTRAILKADLAQAAARRTRGQDGRASANPSTVQAVNRPGCCSLHAARLGHLAPEPRASVQYVEYRLIDGG